MFFFRRILTAITIFLLFFSSASAFVNNTPETIEFREIPQDISFTVLNNENVQRELFVEVFFPIQHQFIQKPGIVEPGETRIVKIKFFPRPDLIGTEFVGTIKTSLGISVSEKNVKMGFFEQNSCPVSINSLILKKEINGRAVFEVISKLQNQKQQQVNISFTEINGLPSNWVVESEKLETLGVNERRNHSIIIKPVEEFEGEAEVFFSCDGFFEKRTVKFSYKSEEEFFSQLTGFASIFSSGNGSIELLVNMVLILIAAILLIAFISRLINKVTPKKEKAIGVEDNGSLPTNKSYKKSHSKTVLELEELKKQIGKKGKK